jgi:hypothetical protein
MSVWIFAGLARLTGAGAPPSLARAVQILNIVAILLLLSFVCVCVPAGERESWFWAVALVSLNPFAVVTQRKIWPPSVLPIFTLGLVVGWWYRNRAWGAALWGAAGSLIGQIHPPSSFLTLGFALWAWLFDRRSVRWRHWILASLLVALPALPWLWIVLHGTGPGQSLPHWQSWVQFRFWLSWLAGSFGFGLNDSVHAYTREFVAWPYVFGLPSYGILLVYIGLVSIAAAGLGRAIARTIRDRPALRAVVSGKATQSDFTLSAVLWWAGFALTASSVPFHWHYMIVLFFLEHLWVARLLLGAYGVRWGRRLLVALCLGEALVTGRFLVFVHSKDRVPGDYGIPWRVQQGSSQ